MIELKPYNYENRLGRCTSRDEYGNADVKGVNMSFMLGLPYEEMAILAQALNRLADFEDAEIAENKKLREKSNKKMSDDLISRQEVLNKLNKLDQQELYLPCYFKEYIIEEVPSVQSKAGHWRDTITAGINETVCSVCLYSGFHHFNYCPYCGAKMGGDGTENG